MSYWSKSALVRTTCLRVFEKHQENSVYFYQKYMFEFSRQNISQFSLIIFCKIQIILGIEQKEKCAKNPHFESTKYYFSMKIQMRRFSILLNTVLQLRVKWQINLLFAQFSRLFFSELKINDSQIFPSEILKLIPTLFFLIRSIVKTTRRRSRGGR